MLELARPGVLVAGAILALVPLLLHLITRRPPERVPLPTARFLRADPRTAIRFQRRPVDLALLALRTLFLLLLALAFAAPTWSAPRRGTIDFVLLDRGRGMFETWPAAVASARRLFPSAPGRAELIAFDTVALHWPDFSGDDVVIDAHAAPTVYSAEGDYAVALRALFERARSSRADSARAWLVTLPRWGAWSAGLAHVREAAWPGAISIVMPRVSGPAADPAAQFSRASEPGRALVFGHADTFAVAAVAALGYRVLRADSMSAQNDTLRAELVLVPSATMTETAADVLLAVRSGGTVIVAGPPASAGLAASVRWGPAADSIAASAPVTFDDGTELATLHAAVPVEPSTGARVIAAGSNGRAVAIAQIVSRRCIVYFAGDLFTRAAGLSQGYASAIRRLARGCWPAGTLDPGRGTEGLPLDSAARALLEGANLPGTVSLSSLATSGGGRSLTRPLLIVAILVALVETWVAYRGGAVR